MKLKIGIFGGSFDPFTEAHMAIVTAALDQNLVDEVYIIPSVVDYYREDKERWLSNDARNYVIRRFIEHYEAKYKDKIFVDDFEFQFAKENAPYVVKKRRFVDTLHQFIHTFGYDDVEFYTIIGTDSYKNFESWSCWKEILELSKLIVVNGRDGKYVYSDIPKIDLEIDKKFLDISATDIRTKYKNKHYEEYVANVLNNQVIESSYMHTPIFEVVKKTINGVDFRPVGINSKDWVSIVVEQNGKYLLVEQLRYGLVTKQTEFPCGMIEKDELPIDAAIRELREETGIILLDKLQITYLGKYAANPAFMNNYMHYFYVNLDNAKFEQRETEFDEHEDLTSSYLDIREFEKRIEECDSRHTSVFMALAVNLVRQLKCKGK